MIGSAMKRMLLLVFMAALSTALVFAAEKPTGEPYYGFVKGEVLLKLKADVPAAGIYDLCSQIRGKIAEHSEELDFYRVELGAMSEADAIKSLRASAEVEWANYNYIAHTFYTPNDPLYSYQWHYPRINMPTAWDITRGSSSVVVAVVDMGFYLNHEDMAGVSTVSPHDYIDGDNVPTTSVYYSHGAHVAGTIFAATSNNTGVAGIAPLCSFMPVRAMDDSGSGTATNIANGISWATTHGADVINLSLGFEVTGPPQDPGPPISTAINNAANAGIVICAASGNDGQNYVGYPAAYAACIAIGATGYNDAIAPYSNRGTNLDVVAPGGNENQDLNGDGYPDGVLSLSRDNTGDIYIFMQGTSMATPHVAGVAALLLSHGLAASDVRQALQETAVDLGASGWDATYGWGRIDAHAALLWQPGGSGSEVTLLSEGFESGVPPANWQLYQGGGSDAGWVSLAGASGAHGNNAYGGSNAAFHNDDISVGDSARDWLITPAVSIPGNAQHAQVTFYQRNYYMVPQYYGRHALLYSTNDSLYHTLQSFPSDQADWGQVTVSVDSLAGRTVWFAFYYVGDNGTEWYVDDVSITATVPGAVDNRNAVPRILALGNPYPNPFNSVVEIPLDLPAPARVELSVFNLLGQRVTTLLPLTPLEAGAHRFAWNAENSASGVYLVRMNGAGIAATRRITLIK
jgi:serine protease